MNRCECCKRPVPGFPAPFDVVTIENRAVHHCAHCGTCDHTGITAKPALPCPVCGRLEANQRAWAGAEYLPRPRAMSDEEFGFRAGLFTTWATKPAAVYRADLEVFADWLADRGSVEEAAARADWAPYASRKDDSLRWWRWAVTGAEGWVSLKWTKVWGPTNDPDDWHSRTYIDADAAKLGRTRHNGAWFLGWPPGWVRFTAPLSHDHRRWRVTIQTNRSLTYSEPVEKVHPAGYATLFHEPGAIRFDAPKPVVRDVPDLFAAVED